MVFQYYGFSSIADGFVTYLPRQEGFTVYVSYRWVHFSPLVFLNILYSLWLYTVHDFGLETLFLIVLHFYLYHKKIFWLSHLMHLLQLRGKSLSKLVLELIKTQAIRSWAKFLALRVVPWRVGVLCQDWDIEPVVGAAHRSSWWAYGVAQSLFLACTLWHRSCPRWRHRRWARSTPCLGTSHTARRSPEHDVGGSGDPEGVRRRRRKKRRC